MKRAILHKPRILRKQSQRPNVPFTRASMLDNACDEMSTPLFVVICERWILACARMRREHKTYALLKSS